MTSRLEVLRLSCPGVAAGDRHARGQEGTTGGPLQEKGSYSRKANRLDRVPLREAPPARGRETRQDWNYAVRIPLAGGYVGN